MFKRLGKPFNRYLINEEGEVFSELSNKILCTKNRKGYPSLNLTCSISGRPFTKFIHRLMAETFLLESLEDSSLQVNHIDGDKTNNNLINLELTTPSQNMKHACSVLRRNQKKRIVIKYDDKSGVGVVYPSLFSAKIEANVHHSSIHNSIQTGKAHRGSYWYEYKGR